MSDINLRPFAANDADWLADQHGQLYARDEGFDDTFAPLVAGILADFLADHDPLRECGWIAEQDGQRLGSIFCVSAGGQAAKLRLFLLTPQARGKGLGKRLLTTCMNFARDAGYHDMRLWTHESHKAACALYASFGWQLVDSKPVHSFGVDLIEQTWTIPL
ncbi:MAG: GNAT superfamily N-acetyltransferase [Paracoccaceae bacterium]|jgi:GNAT superfamily N-acetyltransferase